MKTLVLLTSLMLFTMTAHARLGETPAQVTARYGTMKGTPEIIGTNLWKGTFRHAGFDVTVTFWNGRAVEENFFKDSFSISERDAEMLFRAVSGDGKITSESADTHDPKLTIVDFKNLNNGATGTLFNDGINSGSPGRDQQRVL
jgi:hypothetical protein